MRIDLPVGKSRWFFPERIIGPRWNADAASNLLSCSQMGNRENQYECNNANLHDTPPRAPWVKIAGQLAINPHNAQNAGSRDSERYGLVSPVNGLAHSSIAATLDCHD